MEVDTNDEEEGSVWLVVLIGRGSVDSVDWEGQNQKANKGSMGGGDNSGSITKP